MGFETRVLIEKELYGKATQEEIQFLEEDPQEWRDELVLLIQEIDRELAEVKTKTEMLGKTLSGPEFFRKKAEFDKFRLERSAFKNLALVKIRELKALIKEINRDDPQSSDNILMGILLELKKISGFLEKTK